MQLVEAHHPLAQLQVAVERRQVAVHAVDEARVDRHRNVRAVERHLERRVGYLRALAKNSTFCTSPFIVVPNVRLKLPSALKNADITFSRSARFGSARSVAERRLIELRRCWPSLSVTVGYGKVGVRAGCCRRSTACRRAGRRRRGSSPRLAQRVRARGARCPRGRTRRSSAAARRRGTARSSPCRACRISGSMNDASAPNVGGELHHLLPHALVLRVARVLVGQHARVDVEPRQLLVERVQRVERVGQRRRATTRACPGTGASCGISAASLSFAARHAASVG